MDEETMFWVKVGCGVLIVILLAILNPFHMIGAGEKAVVFNKFTSQTRIIGTGLNVVMPIANQIKKYSVRTTKTDFESIEGLSSDSQTLRLNLVVNWNLDSTRLPEIFKNIQGSMEDTIMYNAIIDTSKAELGKFKIDDIARNREFLRDGIQKSLATRLATQGVMVTNISVTDVDFNEDYEKAIEKKMIAQQGALGAANNKEKARQDAEAVRYTSQTMTNTVLRMEWIKKWSGVLPLYMTGESASIIMNMSGGATSASN